MRIKKVFILELNYTVQLGVATLSEIKKKLALLPSDISSSSYKYWVVENFILGVGELYDFLTDKASNNYYPQDEIDIYINAVYKRLLKHNPNLDPQKIFLDSNNTLTLSKSKIPLISLASWNIQETKSRLLVFDANINAKAGIAAERVEYLSEKTEFPLLGCKIDLRLFDVEVIPYLFKGFVPKNENDVKSYCVGLVVKNLADVINLLASKTEFKTLSISQVLDNLYDIVLSTQPAFNVTGFEIQQFQQGVLEEEEITAVLMAADQSEKKKKRLSGLPLEEIDFKVINSLKENILSEVFEQDEVVTELCNAVSRAYLGCKPPNKPIASFLFYGATGTGKTELAKSLARNLTGSSSNLVNIPCATLLQSAESVNSLIGSPPSYVGYEEGGILQKHFDKKPRAKVILFDEVDKANPRILNMTLEMMDEASLVAANGDKLNLTNAIIIFTSNIGQTEAGQLKNKMGFSKTFSEEDVKKSYNKTLVKLHKPEFLGRLTNSFYFPPLTRDGLIKTLMKELNIFTKPLLDNHKLVVEVDFDTLDYITTKVLEEKKHSFSARDLIRGLHREVIEKIANYLLKNNLKPKNLSSILVTTKESKIDISYRKKLIKRRTRRKTKKRI